MTPILAVFLASLFWTTASQLFAYLGATISVVRINLFKTFISLTLFGISYAIINPGHPSPKALQFLFLSGAVGFAIGDIFILYSFAKMGSARTLILQAFQPSIIAIQAFIILGTTLSTEKIFGLGLLLLCLISLSQDKASQQNFSLKLALIALLGISLDSFGVILTKVAFNMDPNLDSMSANFYRLIMATLVLGMFARTQSIPFHWKDLTKKQKILVVVASILGTYLALYFWLYAISKGNPAVVAAIGAMSPVYSSTYEHIRDRKWPGPWYVLALVFMGLGVFLITRGGL